MIPAYIVTQAKQTNCIDLAEKYSQLRRESSNEFAGPCPKCGGDDRLHVKTDGWFCRQCHPDWADAIEFIRWMNGSDFSGAVSALTGWTDSNQSTKPVTPNVPETQRQPRIEQPVSQDREWIAKAATLVSNCHERLLSVEGEAGRDYLFSRGLCEPVWRTFRLGYRADAPAPNSTHRAPAIVLPWTRGGAVWGIRYRFLAPQSYTDLQGKVHADQRLVSAKSSVLRGGLFGGDGLLGSLESQRTLVLIEGEFNAMSIWQVAFDWRWDVLSIGSEGMRLSDAALAYARKFQRVLVWMDKASEAKRLMTLIPGSFGVSSPVVNDKKRDANDMLQDDTLAQFLMDLRMQACMSEDERRYVRYGIENANSHY